MYKNTTAYISCQSIFTKIMTLFIVKLLDEEKWKTTTNNKDSKKQKLKKCNLQETFTQSNIGNIQQQNCHHTVKHVHRVHCMLQYFTISMQYVWNDFTQSNDLQIKYSLTVPPPSLTTALHVAPKLTNDLSSFEMGLLEARDAAYNFFWMLSGSHTAMHT